MKLYDANLVACLLLRYSVLKQTNDIGGQIMLVTGEEFGNLHSDNSVSSNRHDYWLKNFWILCNTKYPDNMQSILMNWKVSGQYKKCPDNLESVSG